MKKIQFVIAVFSAASFFSACSGGLKNAVINKHWWYFAGTLKDSLYKEVVWGKDYRIESLKDSIYYDSGDSIKVAGFQRQIDEIKYKNDDALDAYFDCIHSYIEFTDDGKFKSNMNGVDQAGTYTIDEDKNLLVFIDDKGKINSYNFEIDLEGSSFLTLTIPDTKTKIELVSVISQKILGEKKVVTEERAKNILMKNYTNSGQDYISINFYKKENNTFSFVVLNPDGSKDLVSVNEKGDMTFIGPLN